ncbi:MAG TPA: hypothetical protein DIS99_15455 [Acinetobacter johnsonii]|nr:hypothetical protein [Acinetobacter johnsonii]
MNKNSSLTKFKRILIKSETVINIYESIFRTAVYCFYAFFFKYIHVFNKKIKKNGVVKIIKIEILIIYNHRILCILCIKYRSAKLLSYGKYTNIKS